MDFNTFCEKYNPYKDVQKTFKLVTMILDKELGNDCDIKYRENNIYLFEKGYNENSKLVKNYDLLLHVMKKYGFKESKPDLHSHTNHRMSNGVVFMTKNGQSLLIINKGINFYYLSVVLGLKFNSLNFSKNTDDLSAILKQKNVADRIKFFKEEGFDIAFKHRDSLIVFRSKDNTLIKVYYDGSASVRKSTWDLQFESEPFKLVENF